MEVSLNNQGALFLKGLNGDLPSFVRRARKSDWCWSSWHWLPDVRRSLPGWNEFNFRDQADYQTLIMHKNNLLHALKRKSILKTNVFDKCFTLPLWEAQKHAASMMVAAKNFYLSDDVGLGKTLSAVAGLMVLFEFRKITTALIICPASVKFQWAAEITRALTPEMALKYPVRVIHGSKLKRLEQYKDPNVSIFVTNYESFRVDIQSGPNVLLQTPGCLILDEAWKVKSFRSKTQKIIREHARPIHYRWALNASPVGNSYEELFGVFDIIDPLLFLNWTNFSANYLKFVEIRLKTGRVFKKLVGYRNTSDLEKRIRHMFLRRRVDDMGWKSPTLTVTPYWVDLTSQQRKEYNALRSAAKLEPLVRVVRARQACLFTDIRQVAKMPKTLELLDFLTHTVPHEKVLVFSESRTYLEALMPLMRKAHISTGLLSGGASADDRELMKHEFTEGKMRVLMATAAGEAGLNLQVSNVIVNLDVPYNPERLRQRVGRLRPHLGGEGRHIRVVNILARNTIEERVIEIVQKKAGDFARLFREEQLDLTGVFRPDLLVGLI